MPTYNFKYGRILCDEGDHDFFFVNSHSAIIVGYKVLKWLKNYVTLHKIQLQQYQHHKYESEHISLTFRSEYVHLIISDERKDLAMLFKLTWVE